MSVSLLISALIFLQSTRFATAGLYSATDDVIILDYSNFHQQVLSSDTAWIVEFYNSWCGHCIHFAPTWKLFSTDLKGWRRVVKVGAIDCADDKNTDVCREYEASAFPVFKLLPPHATASDKGEQFHEQEQTALRQKVVDFVSAIAFSQRQPTWPRLSPLKTMDTIWDEVKDSHHYVVLVLEEEKMFLAREVILDMSGEDNVIVRRMTKPSVQKYGIKNFPSMYLILRDGKFQRIAQKETSREGFVKVLHQLLSDSKNDMIQEGAGAGEGANVPADGEKPQHQSIKDKPNQTENKQSYKSVRVQMQDLESTLHYSFRQEIAIHKTVSGEALKALKNFIHVLAKYFPGREPVRKFLWRVHKWISGIVFQVSGEGWLEKIDSLQDSDVYLPDKIEWDCCRGIEMRYRGYPCGMWTLFHTLTVSAYSAGKTDVKYPLEVLSSIGGYMRHFFGCQECAKNFGKMTHTGIADIKTGADSVLWLWQAHNKANKRLHGDVSEDPKHPKVQFPPEEICHTCHTNGEWNMKEVLKFLLDFYDPEHIIQTGDKIVDTQGQGHKNEVQKSPDSSQLDWWERQQRKNDLEKIYELRQSKKRKIPPEKETLNKWSNRNETIQNLNWGDVGDGGIYRVGRGLGKRGEFRSAKASTAVFGWGFSNVDMSMCVIFYILCTLIIVVMYYHFIVRRNFKPCRLLLPR